MPTKISYPTSFTQHAGFRACARVLLLALLAVPWAGPAEAFPAQPIWGGRNSTGNCLFEGNPLHCMLRDTKAEIFTAVEAVADRPGAGSCGAVSGWFLSFGVFPDEVWQRNWEYTGFDLSCNPPNPLVPFLAVQISAVLKCPKNSTQAGSQCTCNAPFQEANNACGGGENNGVCDQCKGQPAIGNPANPANGNKFEQQPVYRGLNGFDLSLSFNTYDDYPTRYGHRWRDSFDRRVSVDGSGVVTFRQDGKVFRFVPAGGGWVSEADTNDRLSELKDSLGTRTGWQLYVAAGDETETYDASGKLLSIRSRTGLVQTLTYSDGTGGPNGGFVLDANGQATTAILPAGLLIRAADHFGRTIAFGYEASSRVARVTDPAAGVYFFGYDAAGNLASIAFPDAGVRGFAYNEAANTGGAALPNALTGITDENGARFATFQYDAQERAVSTEHAGGAQRYTLSYGAGGSTTVTDPLGTARTYGFDIVLGAFKNTGIAGPPCPACGPAVQSSDANGNVASRTDWNGNVTLYGYDLARNLETSRSEAFGTAQARTITTQWHPGFRLPVRVAEPLRITSYVYNGDGVSCGFLADGATLVPGVLCAKTIQPTSDATGAAGLGATPVGGPRTWRYTYNANGSVLTMDGPRTDVADVTAYAYYANDDADPGRRGNLAAFANALGHTTQILAYNAHGQPLVIVNPNGLTTNLTYDPRMRLASRNVGGEVTIYSYDSVGQLTRVTLPDASFVAYGYDAAHRLTLVQDNLGNRIAYTLDAMGNRVAEQVLDPAGALAQTRSRVYDGLNRLFQDIGAQAQTTQYAYDNQGNLTGVTDPLNQVTANAYDVLNRLIRVTDPGNGQTQYAYNGIDRLVAVSDPRNLATTYNYDGLANLNAQASPDTGDTVNAYDAAGNLLTQTDAKGQPTSYTYDALNRVTSITFADGSKQSYGYDQGSNGLGRLTFFAETNPQNQIAILHDYAYDAHGRAITENRTMNGVTYAMRYGYDAAGRLSGVTYPSGRTVAYDFDALGRVSQVSTTPPPASGGATQVVVSNVAYQPFGGVKGYTLGNGQSYTRSYDTDGRIASYGFGNQVFTLGYDPSGRIISITDTGNALNSSTYGYDSLDRLTSALRAAGSFGYGYDAVGNRTSKTAGSASDTYTYSTTSNRIAGVAGATSRSFVFDANGSTTSDGPNQYGYDSRGRMVQSSNATSGTTAYQVNALGQRIRKTNSLEDRMFLYDMRGRLIAETSPAGAILREYLYLNDIPIAVIQ
jgi:YD repeat-containing protein